MRFFHPAWVAAALIAAVPYTAMAGTTIGGSIGSARVNEGDFEDDDTGWKAFIGSHGELFGGEIAYIDFGEQGEGAFRAEPTAWAPAILVGLPFSGVQVHGKLGLAFPEVEGANIGDEYEDNEVFYGAGLRFGRETGIGFRLEYERFDFGGDDLDLASAGLEFRF